MATYLYCWELGAGRGHLVPNLALAKRLRERGHDVVFALRDLRHAEHLLGIAQFRYLQAPTWIAPQAGAGKRVRSYPQMLLNLGYTDVDQLVGWLRAWRELFEWTGATALILDHSPTALVAARGLDLPSAMLGNGFSVPPLQSPLPALVDELDDALHADEKWALDNVNAALARLDADPVEHLADLLDVEVRAVRSLPEFDHYGPRDDVIYAPALSKVSGEHPAWPDTEGPRVFAYLRPGPMLAPALNVLARRRMATLVCGEGLPNEVVKQFSSRHLVFTSRLHDLEEVAERADLVLLNANHSTTLALLLNGCPVLLAPQQLEQSLFAQRVAAQGVGRVITEPKQTAFDLGIEALLREPGYRAAAKAFAQRHAACDYAASENALVDRIEAMVAKISRGDAGNRRSRQPLH